MHRRLASLLATAALLLSIPLVQAAAPPASRDAISSGADLDTSSAIVVLKQQPVAMYDGHVAGYEKTRPAKGTVNPNSAAAKKYVGYLKTEHSAFQKWLQTNVPSAKVTSQYYTVMNAVAVKLNGAAIGKLSNNAEVVSVEYNALYHPLMSESYKLINATGAWTQAGGRVSAGAGVKVGVIDSGVDYRHPFLDSTGFAYPTAGGPWPKCDAADTAPGGACKNVSPKVIVAKVFYNKNNQTDYDALPVKGEGDHGTHVSGTIAGVTGKVAIVNGVSIDDMSGVAPRAWLGNYNVFPGAVVNARSEDILNAVEAATNDGMQVLNLSLGGAYHGNNDLLAKGLDNAVAGGVVVAVAAGNSGPGGSTIESPGRARNILTAGASTNNHFVGQPVRYGTAPVVTVGAAIGDFPALPAGTFDLFVSGTATALSDACASLPASTKTNEIVLVTRGTCTFSTKVRSAIAAGYDGVIVRNNVAGDPTAMAKDGLGGDNLPAAMLSKGDGDALRAAHPATVTPVASFSEFVTSNGDILAGFSSQGPTRVDFAIKPDLTSVGVNVLSSVACPSTGTCGGEGDWAFFSGTSMATPHLAGSAAVLLDLHPDWAPGQIKSALVNTADLVVKNAFDASTTVGPMQQGGGRENLTEAANPAITLSPTSASFGKVSGTRTSPTSLTIRVSNLTSVTQTYNVAEHQFTPAPGAVGATFGAGTIGGADSRVSTPTSITVPAAGSANLTISVNAGLARGTIAQGWVSLTGGGGEYHFAYWAQIP
jgi:minor extracellular serine protease Vpr